MSKTIAYKGFDKNLKCRDFQYEVGKEYETDKAEPCESGFHACESPLSVWDYYPPCDENRFCEVEQSGEIKEDGKKSASTKIKIGAEIGIAGLIKAHINLISEKTSSKIRRLLKIKKINDNGEDYAQIGSSGDYAQIGSSGDSAKIGSSGDYAQIGSSGYYAQIGSSGNYAQIGSSGYSAQIDCKGRNAVVACAGANNMVRGVVGTWACLSEYAVVDGKYRCIGMKAFQIDGVKYKADTWLTLRNGEIVEAQEKE
jgi:hypothetical protein